MLVAVLAIGILTTYAGKQMEKELEDNVYLRLKACATSATGAEKIQSIAKNIMDKSNSSVKLAKQIKQIIDTEQSNIIDAQKSFELLSNAIEETLVIADTINDKTNKLDTEKQGIIDNIDSLSAISEENAANNEEVSATTTNVADAINGIKSETEKVDSMAKELVALMKYFNV